MIAKLKCPKCGFIENIEVPKDMCIVMHDCNKCGYLMKATNEKDCCVICMYSDKKCEIKVEEV